MTLDLFSVVTPVFQDPRILRTIESVAEQATGFPVEHIIIDGGSGRDFVSKIRAVSGEARILSEPDEGIYDAMNKGISLARGDVISILNADDYYATRRSLQQMCDAIERTGADAAYGDMIMVTDGGKPVRYWKAGTYKKGKYYRGWMPPHPTVSVRREAYLRWGDYDTSFPISADYEWMLRASLVHDANWGYVAEPVTCMTAGGASNGSLGKALRANFGDIRRAWKKHGLHGGFAVPILKPASKIPQFLGSSRRAIEAGFQPKVWSR